MTALALLLRWSIGAQARDAFLAANPPPWDDLPEPCHHAAFSDKLDEPLDHITDATQHIPTAPCVINASPGTQSFRYGAV